MILKNKKISVLLILTIISLSLCVIGFTYAFFTVEVEGNEEASVISLDTAKLSLTYDGGPEVVLRNAYSGDNIQKTFTVTNTGTSIANYDINFIDLVNTITRNELIVSYTCESFINYGLSNEMVSGSCEGLNQLAILNDISSQAISYSTPINPGITHVYTLRVEFKEMGSNQNYNAKKSFSAKININQSQVAYKLSGIVKRAGIVLSNAMIKLIDKETNSYRSAETNELGEFTIPNVPEGSYNFSVEYLGEVYEEDIVISTDDEVLITDSTLTGTIFNQNLNFIVNISNSNISFSEFAI